MAAGRFIILGHQYRLPCRHMKIFYFSQYTAMQKTSQLISLPQIQ